MTTSGTSRASWEYLMPKRKERMALYIRESNPGLATGTTIESQAKVCREYGEKEGYIYDPDLEFREAISAYEIPYTERKELLRMLDAAKKKFFDVLVISEVRALGRRQVEVLVLYDMLQKHGIRLETVQEKFGEDAMSKAILSLRTMFVEIEVEQSRMRMSRGRADRLVIGGAPNAHPKAAYGYVFVNTEKEVKGGYEFNHIIILVDAEGNEWSEYKVVMFIFALFRQGYSIHSICRELNRLQIPPPKKALKGEPHWQKGSLYSILTNPIYCGEVWANRFKAVRSEKTNKLVTVSRPKEEWIRLPDAPAIISKEEFEAVQQQLQVNKKESLRHNSKPKEELGLLRCGYIFCGICGRKMHLCYPSAAGKRKGVVASYVCEQTTGILPGVGRHRTRINIPVFDGEVVRAIREVLLHPSWVRERVAELRQKPEPVITEKDIQTIIEKLKKSMQNLYTFAEHAPDDEELARLTQRLQELGKQKREAEAMLYEANETKEQDNLIEAEIVRFEQWVIQVSPLLTDPHHQASYEELRLAVRVLGLRATIWPTQGDYPYRWRIDVTIPAVLQRLDCNMNEPLLKSSRAAACLAENTGLRIENGATNGPKWTCCV